MQLNDCRRLEDIVAANATSLTHRAGATADAVEIGTLSSQLTHGEQQQLMTAHQQLWQLQACHNSLQQQQQQAAGKQSSADNRLQQLERRLEQLEKRFQQQGTQQDDSPLDGRLQDLEQQISCLAKAAISVEVSG